MNKVLLICTLAGASQGQDSSTYFPSDCKGELRDLGLNPHNYNRRATFVYGFIGSDNVGVWNERHLGKFDSSLFDVIDLQDETVHVPNLFISEEHVL